MNAHLSVNILAAALAGSTAQSQRKCARPEEIDMSISPVFPADRAGHSGRGDSTISESMAEPHDLGQANGSR